MKVKLEVQPRSIQARILIFVCVIYASYAFCCGLPAISVSSSPLVIEEELTGQLGEIIRQAQMQQEIILNTPVLHAWSLITTYLRVFMGFGYFACFWGFIQWMPWARLGFIGLTLVEIVLVLMGSVINHLFFNPILAAQMDMDWSVLDGLLGSMTGVCCSMILPISFLFLALSPKNFRRRNASEETDLPVPATQDAIPFPSDGLEQTQGPEKEAESDNEEISPLGLVVDASDTPPQEPEQFPESASDEGDDLTEIESEDE